MKTSKSPNAIARLAYTTAQRALPAYTHKFSPKKFTQHQLAACLVLKEFFKTDYRGLVAILNDSSDLREILELATVPHFTTIQKSAQTILKKKRIKKLIAEIIRIAQKSGFLEGRVFLAAMDSTGMESRHISSYFVKRRERGRQDLYQTTTYTRFPKLALACDTATHIIIGALALRGPSVDIVHFKDLMRDMLSYLPVHTLCADAGYDSEESHRFGRENLNIRTIIPNRTGRPTNKLPTGRYRRIMATQFNKKLYGQRWQSETVMSMIKRNLGEALSAVNYWSQCRQIMLKVLTHNIMVVL